MKTKLISYLAVGLFLFFFNDRANAQEQTLPPVTVTATTNIAKAVTKSFAESFPEATNEHWYKMSKRYLVDFMENDHNWHGVAPNDEQLSKALAQLPETLGDY